MPIYRDKASGCLVFEFSRYIQGQRIRARKILPRSWTQAQADAFDRRESARLYAVATGIERAEVTIDQAVACYIRQRVPHMKSGMGTAAELANIAWVYAGKPLAALPEVCRTYADRERDRLSPATIKNRIRYLSAACRYAWKHAGMGEHDPAARVVAPMVRNERQRYVDRADMLRIAKACRNRAVRAAIRIAWYSGMRWGEIARAERDMTQQAFILTDTKNGRPRLVPMHPRLRVLAGYTMPTKYIQHYHWTRACAVAGIGDLVFHDLRHSTASALLAAGYGLGVVGAVLGHTSAQSTKRYSHMDITAQAAAVNRLGRRA